MNKYVFLAGIFIFSAFNVFSQTAAPETDVQFWSDTSVAVPLVKKKNKQEKDVEKIGFFLTGAFRAGGNVSRPIDKRIGFGFDFFVNQYFRFTPSYFYRAGQPDKFKKEYEHRVRFDFNLGKKWSRFSLSDRSRIEYRIRNSTADSVRYRNKLQLNIPVKKNNEEIFTPFVATEPFYDFRARKWTRNEFSVGVNRKINNNLSADFFYLLQNNRGSGLRIVNAFGVNLKFKIDRSVFTR
jgi:hypothetical protein